MNIEIIESLRIYFNDQRFLRKLLAHKIDFFFSLNLLLGSSFHNFGVVNIERTFHFNIDEL